MCDLSNPIYHDPNKAREHLEAIRWPDGLICHQIHRNLGVTYKTAWFMTHRIREAMKHTANDQLGGPGSSGIDEVYLRSSLPRRGSSRPFIL